MVVAVAVAVAVAVVVVVVVVVVVIQTRFHSESHLLNTPPPTLHTVARRSLSLSLSPFPPPSHPSSIIHHPFSFHPPTHPSIHPPQPGSCDRKKVDSACT